MPRIKFLSDNVAEVTYKKNYFYRGGWLYNKPHGKGSVYSKDSKILIYDGDWLEGKMCGTGTSFYPDGSKNYEGDWLDNKRHGKGSFYSEDSTILLYEGDWLDNKRHGKGSAYSEDSKIIYKGDWLEGKMCGTGISFFPDGSKNYEGDWLDNKRHGKGSVYRKDSKILLYEGDWLEGKICGIGASFYPDGSENYKGQWRDGKIHGEGVYYLKNGSQIKGVFERNMLLPSEASKTRSVIVLKLNPDLPDPSPAIIQRYGRDTKIFLIDSKKDITGITDFACKTKQGDGLQLVIDIISHGNPLGGCDDEDFIKSVIEQIRYDITEYNKELDEDDLESQKIERIKINCSTCYGDAVITNKANGLVTPFVKAGIKVRTAGSESLSSTMITDGKYHANFEGGETIICERFFAQTPEECQEWLEGKRDKYLDLGVEQVCKGVWGAVGKKVYNTIDDFMNGEYVRPETSPKKGKKRMAEDNLVGDDKRQR